MKSGPQFKPIGIGVRVLNSWDRFWTELGSTHVAFKKGIGKDQLLLNEGSSPEKVDAFISVHNWHYVYKRGNKYSMPEFKHSYGRGYYYGKILWFWHCRICQNEIPRKALDSNEVCFKCNGNKINPMVPL